MLGLYIAYDGPFSDRVMLVISVERGLWLRELLEEQPIASCNILAFFFFFGRSRCFTSHVSSVLEFRDRILRGRRCEEEDSFDCPGFQATEFGLE